MKSNLREIRCAGCERVTGFTGAKKLSGAVYCSEYCADEPPLSSNEERDDVVVELFRAGEDQVGIALELEMTRQRVGQVLQERSVLR